jgi:hypothetical protein
MEILVPQLMRYGVALPKPMHLVMWLISQLLMLRNLKDQMWCWILKDERLNYKFIFCNHSHWQKLCQTLLLWHKFDQMCLDWNKLCQHEGHLITLDAHYKSQHFVGGDNYNLPNSFVFYNHDCNTKIWTHFFVQINNHFVQAGRCQHHLQD